MSEELYFDNLGLAPGVLETIVSIAAKEVEGVAAVGSSTLSGLSRFVSSKAKTPIDNGVEASMAEDGVAINVHIDVQYGKPIPVIAEEVRQAVSDAVATQVGFAVSSIDIYVDGIRFAE